MDGPTVAAMLALVAFFGIVGYRIYKSRSKPRSTGTGGGGTPRSGGGGSTRPPTHQK